MRLDPIALAALLLAGTAHAAPSPEQVAAAALKAAPVWDGHNDVPEQLRERYRNVIADFDFADTTGTADPAKDKGPMHTDLARLAEGRVGAQFWSVYIDAGLTEQQAVQATLEQIDVMKRILARHPDRLRPRSLCERRVARCRGVATVGVVGRARDEPGVVAG